MAAAVSRATVVRLFRCSVDSESMGRRYIVLLLSRLGRRSCAANSRLVSGRSAIFVRAAELVAKSYSSSAGHAATLATEAMCF